MLQFPQQNCKETKLVKMKCVLSSVRKGYVLNVHIAFLLHHVLYCLCKQSSAHISF